MLLRTNHCEAVHAVWEYIWRVNAPKSLYLVHFGMVLVRRSTDYGLSLCCVSNLEKDKALAYEVEAKNFVP